MELKLKLETRNFSTPRIYSFCSHSYDNIIECIPFHSEYQLSLSYFFFGGKMLSSRLNRDYSFFDNFVEKRVNAAVNWVHNINLFLRLLQAISTNSLAIFFALIVKMNHWMYGLVVDAIRMLSTFYDKKRNGFISSMINIKACLKKHQQ